MKKSFRKMFAVISTMVMVMSLGVLSVNADSNEKKDNTPYSFPVLPGSSEWESFTTKQEKLSVCQIPDDKLVNMTTDALLETVMNYPFIHDYMAFNSYEDACRRMSEDFNGFSELFSREDITSAILSKYSSAHVVSADEIDTVDSASFFEPSTLEYLFVCDEINNGEITGKELELFSEIHSQKSYERNVAGIYSIQSEVYCTHKQSEILTRAGETWTVVASGTVKTPKGSKVPEVYKRSPELTTAEKNSLNSQMAKTYPRVTRIAQPTVKYNCHSYAWYSRSTSNPYWIGRSNPPKIYTTDGSYKRYSGTPRSGMKAWYNGGEHSGISIGAKMVSGVQVHYVESKWGMCGVYQHAYNDCPYSPSVAWYTR